MDNLERYLDYVQSCLRAVVEKERETLERAAGAMIEKFRGGRVVHIYGPGVHSHIAAEDAFCRKGGLIPVNALLDVGTSAADGARDAHRLEGMPEHADACLEKYGIGKGDLLIVANAYGFNALCVQAALRARELGARTIAITSPAFAEAMPPDAPNRHPTGKNLSEVADIVIDNHMAPGETVIPVPGAEQVKVGAVATILHSFIINCLVIRVAEIMASGGEDPPVVSFDNQARTDRIRAGFAKQLKHY